LTYTIATGGPNAQIGTTAEFFEFGKAFNESYMGTAQVRGILCNHWQAVSSMIIPVYNATTNTTTNMTLPMTLDWYFEHPDFSLPNTDGFQAPVRLRLQGVGSDGDYDHFYDYVTFSGHLSSHDGDTSNIFQVRELSAVECRQIRH
jgi:hypothetical protein